MPISLNPIDAHGTYMPLKVIQTLVRNFFQWTTKKDPETGASRALGTKLDSFTIWFTKKEIDDLFAENIPQDEDPSKFGLRIYLCQHWDTDVELEQIKEVQDATGGKPNADYEDYKGQHGVILVVTKRDELGVNNDLLSNSNSVSIPAKPLTGLDVGQPCPPPSICKGVSIKAS